MLYIQCVVSCNHISKAACVHSR